MLYNTIITGPELICSFYDNNIYTSASDLNTYTLWHRIINKVLFLKSAPSTTQLGPKYYKSLFLQRILRCGSKLFTTVIEKGS
jgi:hypothetical protein